MRLVPLLMLLLVVLGCAAPPSSGGLWALDAARLEDATVFRTPDPQRRAMAREVELRAVDDLLAGDEARISGSLAACPAPSGDLSTPSAGDAVRDAARAKDDADRRAHAARLAVADWYVRRGASTGEADFCDRARQALSGSVASPSAAALAIVQDLPPGEVTISGTAPAGQVIDAASEPAAQVSLLFRLGLVDGVRGPALLVAELAAVSAGTLSLPATPPPTDLTPEQIVDQVAPALASDWEPDGAYAALRAVRR